MASPAYGGLSGWVYNGSLKRALVVGVMLSYGVVHLIAAVLEHRSMMDPSGQYKAFYYGDLFCLPGVVLAIWYLGHYVPDGPNLSRKFGWHLTCLGVGLIAGIGLHLLDAASHFYTRSQEQSPTKLYHDFVVFPLYIYILASAGFTALGKPERWLKMGWQARLAIVVLLAVFAGLNVWDNNHRPHHGQVNYNWHKFP